MALLTPIQRGALRVGESLRQVGKNFRTNVKSTVSSSTQVINRTREKIYANDKKVESEKKKQAQIDRRVEEQIQYQNREDNIERKKAVKSAPLTMKAVLLDKPLDMMKMLTLAWLVKNGPKILKDLRIMTKRVRVFMATVKRVPGAVYGVVRAAVGFSITFMQNVLNFNFEDRRKKMEAARMQFDMEVDKSTTTFTEMRDVWSREEDELDRMIEQFESGSTVDQIVKELSGEKEPAPLPQNPAVGPQPAKSSGSSAPPSGETTKSGNLGALLKTISYAEGTSGPDGYNKWFGGRTDMDLSQMTINEVGAEMDRRNRTGENRYGRYASSAVGKYQMMAPEAAARTAGLNPAVDKYTPENQDKMVVEHYIKGQAKLTDAEINGPLTPEIIDKLAPVFASFPNLFGPDNKGRYGTNTSYYGQGGKTKDQITDYYNNALAQAPAQAAPAGSPTQPSVQAPQPAAPVNSSVVDEYKGGRSKRIVETSPYGVRRHPITGQRRMHKGIDIAPPGAGYKVALKIGGKVTRVGNDPSGYGNFVIISSQQTGLSYMFAHLKSVYVRNGDTYTGQAIGEIGSTGLGTGIHLHYEVYRGGKDGPEMDPRPYLGLLIIGRNNQVASAAGIADNRPLSASTANGLDRIASRPTGGTQKQTNILTMTQKEVILVG